MPSITIVSGCPGIGKTTLAEQLARNLENGMHLAAEAFLDAITSPIAGDSHDPTVTIDTARAAGVFASGGRDVFVDGVVGPWFVPVFARELTSLGVSLDYVVLRAGSDETLARAGICEKPPSETIVRTMQAAFADLGELERHAVDTDGHTPQQTLAQVRRRGLSGDFQLDLARYSS